MNQGLITALYAGFFDRYGDQVAPAHREVCERLVATFDAYLAEEAASDRIHRDWSTATTAWTTCCSERPAPTAR